METSAIIHRRIITNINRLLAKNGLLAEHLCNQGGIDRGNFSKFMQAKKSASLHTVQKMAEGLGVDVEQLFLKTN